MEQLSFHTIKRNFAEKWFRCWNNTGFVRLQKTLHNPFYSLSRTPQDLGRRMRRRGPLVNKKKKDQSAVTWKDRHYLSIDLHAVLVWVGPIAALFLVALCDQNILNSRATAKVKITHKTTTTAILIQYFTCLVQFSHFSLRFGMLTSDIFPGWWSVTGGWCVCGQRARSIISSLHAEAPASWCLQPQLHPLVTFPPPYHRGASYHRDSSSTANWQRTGTTA